MTKLFILPAIFVGATFSLWLLICNAPEWGDESQLIGTIHQQLREGDEGGKNAPLSPSMPIELPTQFENFTVMADQFRAYKTRHTSYITTLFICGYLYKQTFAIPGSFFLNIAAGAVFGLWTGFLLCCVLTTIGSTLCYLFSEFFSREYVLYYFGEKITYLQRKVDDNSHRLLPFLLFARMFPISPSWLLNIVAPFLNIPLPIFAFSVFVGLAPYNFICVQAGFILSDLTSWDDVFSTATMLKLCSFALLPLCYAMFVKRQRKQTIIKTIPTPIKYFYSSNSLPILNTSKLQHLDPINNQI
ncbi:SNARE associated Golgi protein [Globodera pallida]|uniref:Transmembrane protein 41A n=1 Tax=Globodera pallida TaxID=36090 RepID=A0A183C1N5_GLOPA|nr:SNARE associated Golgi protein [Globodera pallida]